MDDLKASTDHPRRDMPTFLTVDDEPAINWALGRLIKQHGFTVDHAISGQSALELIAQRPYQVVFIDAKLPDMSGLVLADQLRERLGDAIVVLISGYFFDDDPVVEKAMDDGLIQFFIAKPFLHGDIRALINRLAVTLTD